MEDAWMISEQVVLQGEVYERRHSNDNRRIRKDFSKKITTREARQIARQEDGSPMLVVHSATTRRPSYYVRPGGTS